MTTHAHTEQGFTLVELIVSLGVFMIVMTIALGSVLSIFSANRRAENESLVMNNLNLALETMSREMRYGTNYHCGSDTPTPYTTALDCPTGDSIISFLTSDGKQVVYELSGTTLMRSENGGAFIGVTAPEITLTSLRFYVFGSKSYASGDTRQPKTVIAVQGNFGSRASEQIGFSLQTVVSQRVLDN